MRLASRLLLQTVLPALVIIVLFLGIVTHEISDVLENTVHRGLTAVAQARHQDIRVHFERMKKDIVAMGSAPAVTQALIELAQAYASCPLGSTAQLQALYGDGARSVNPSASGKDGGCRNAYDQAHDKHDDFFRRRHVSYGWQDMYLIDTQANVVYSIRKGRDFAANLAHGAWKDSGLARAATTALKNAVVDMPTFADAERYRADDDTPALFLAIAMFDPASGQAIGALAVRIALDQVNEHLAFKAGLGETGEAFLVGKDGWMLSNSFFDKESSVLKRQLKTEAVRRVLAGEQGSDELIDYRGIPSFISYLAFQPFNGVMGDQAHWGVIAKTGKDEALVGLSALQHLLVVSGSIVALLATLLSIFNARRLFGPVAAMSKALTRLAKGENARIPGVDRRDEIGEMAKAAQKFLEMSEKVAHERWLRENVATLGAAMSQESSLSAATEVVLSFLRRTLGVPVAALYLRDDSGCYCRVGAQGLARRNQAQDRFALGESMVGQCARDLQPALLSPVPAGLMVISTGLAEFPPCELALYPIVHKNATLAVVELGAIHALTPPQHELLASLTATLGVQLSNIATAQRNLELLNQSQEQTRILGEQKTELGHKNIEVQALADEMRQQSEELKTQNEEFRATQEELRAQQEELLLKNRMLEGQGRQLELSRQEAETRAKELAQSNQYKSQFLANMSHELRTPLNSILILAKHLAENSERNLDADQVESAGVIHESGCQLLSLINDILDLSKIEAGKLEMQAESFAASEMLLYLGRLFEPLAQKKAIAFDIVSTPANPGALFTDRRHLTQVLTNLLSNAIKFTETGSVQLLLHADDDRLLFEVVDTGIGIAADKIEHVFGAFQQVDSGANRKYGGSGLGLAISRQLVNLLGGQLEVQSTLGQGSRFTVRLPRNAHFAAPELASKPATTATAAAPSHAAPSPGLPILVVEDDARLLPIVSRLIESLGYRVCMADSGEKALKWLSRERPAGVLLDLGLPGIPGMDVLRRIKSDESTADIPVYIMSGAADTGQARTLGAIGYLHKPITREAVQAALRTMLGATPMTTTMHAKPQQLLLVEDDEASAHAVNTLLKNLDIAIEHVRLGEHGLSALKTTAFDAVVLDLTLPDMNGIDWLERAARANPHYPPVIVYSARDLSDDELLRLRAYSDAIVSKGRLNEHVGARLREEVMLALSGKARAAEAPPPIIASAPNRALLIVDDDLRNQAALSKVLRAKGYAVTAASSGARALEILADNRFDAILTDIMMPEMDGYELTRRLRAIAGEKLPIIAVTAKAMTGDIDLCLAAGATDYLAKPVDIDRLLALLDRWIV